MTTKTLLGHALVVPLIHTCEGSAAAAAAFASVSIAARPGMLGVEPACVVRAPNSTEDFEHDRKSETILKIWREKIDNNKQNWETVKKMLEQNGERNILESIRHSNILVSSCAEYAGAEIIVLPRY